MAEQERKVKADLHNHLRTSSLLKDSDFNKAIDIASERLGKGGTFGMVNFADKRYEEFIGLTGYERVHVGEKRNAIYVPEKDVLVVKGQEIPMRVEGKTGHLLVLGLGYNEHIKQYQSLGDSVRQARELETTIIADHPFFFEGIGQCLWDHFDLVSGLDAIEVYNGEADLFSIPFFHSPANFWAKKLHERVITYPVGAISTSDGHSFYELGRSWTEINEINKNPKEFLKSLKKSVQNTKNAERMNYNGRFGAINHILNLIWITKIVPSFGLGWIYETERPEYYLPPKKLPKENHNKL